MSDKKGTTTLNVVLQEFTRHGINIIQLLESIDAIVSDTSSDFVTVEITKTDGTLVQKKIPSIGKIQNDISALQNMLTDLYDVKDNTVFLLDDGVRYPIYIPDYPHLDLPPSDLVKTEFVYKFENYFSRFYINNIYNKVKYEKIILDLDTNAFSELPDDLSHDDYLLYLSDNEITYKTEIGVINKEPGLIKNNGSFLVLSNVKNVYRLNTITYSNNLNETFRLNVNDKIIFKNTEVIITQINYDTNEITVNTVKGYDSILVGDELTLYSQFTFNSYIDIPCKINEKYVIFFKNINEHFNVETINHSLPFNVIVSTLLNEDGQSLIDFNTSEVEDVSIPRYLGIKPNTPSLNNEDYNVTRINDHLFTDNTVKSVQEKISRKTELRSEMDEIDKAINGKKEALSSTPTSSENKIKSIESDIQSLSNTRQLKSKEYTSIVNELLTIQADEVSHVKPKYRIRGFFEMPSSVYSEYTGEQEIVFFKIAYRYKNKNESNTTSKNFTYKGSEGENKFGVFSDWNEIESKKRVKVEDSNTGEVKWELQKTEDGNEVNINQIDITITKNELVEFRIKSASEAGYPSETLFSDWSNVASIEFPEELGDVNNLADILESSLQDSSTAQVENLLISKGVDKHITNSTNINEKYFGHPSNEVSSGIYLDNELKSVEDILKIYGNDINLLKDAVSQTIPEIGIQLITENGEEIDVNSNSTVKLFTGYYKDQIQNLPSTEQDGAEIIKNYQLRIYNKSGYNMYLRSYIHGGFNEDLEDDSISDPVYTNRQYWDVPILVNGNKSSQKKGSYIYSRYKDVGLNTDLYSNNSLSHTWYVGSQTNNTDDYQSTNKDNAANTPTFGDSETGLYTVMNLDSINDTYIGAPDYGSTKVLEPGKENGIIIPLLIKYKLTDNDGYIGGNDTFSNIEYRKKIGFDIFLFQLNTFSFDIETICKYDKDTI